jgi:DNA-binding Lrp family transcriptional regulator
MIVRGDPENGDGSEPNILDYTFQKLDLDIKNITKVVITHSHDDHWGGLANLLQKKTLDILVYNDDIAFYEYELSRWGKLSDYRILGLKDGDIIRILARRANLSGRTLSKMTGLPISTVQRRIKRLEREGVIKGYKAVIDYEKSTKPTSALILVNLPEGPAEKHIPKISVPSGESLDSYLERLSREGLERRLTFFKDKKVAVVGGGNSALVEAIYLKQLVVKKLKIAVEQNNKVGSIEMKNRYIVSIILFSVIAITAICNVPARTYAATDSRFYGTYCGDGYRDARKDEWH